MNSALRGILAIVAGFVVACIIMVIVESINGHVLYPELGKQAQGVTDREQIRKIFEGAPSGALLVVLFGWVVGSAVGALVATWIARSASTGHALFVGILVTLGAIANNLMLPPPMWFWVVGVILPIPAALMGGRLAPKAAAA
jgi:hypothetical protein